MIRLDNSHSEVATVSNPGVVRNFRVQVREANRWRSYNTFRQRTDAESCIEALKVGGVQARLVDCDRCPTAL